MTTATKAVHNRIAIVFDFDDTLAPNSYRSLVERCGLSYDTFKDERVQPLLDAGWDEILAKFYCLIEESRQHNNQPITQSLLADIGGEIQFFDGVPEMFDRLRKVVRDLAPGVDLEFYLLSSGILEIARGTPIASKFKDMWGCEFHFDDDGAIRFIKKIVTHPEKVRYLLQLSRGVGATGEQGQPAHVYRPVPESELYLPLEQIIYVGDGSSDMPVFRLLNDRKGTAIGVFKGQSADEWNGFKSMHSRRRVDNLAPVDYREEGELMQSLTLAVESICKRIALHQLSEGE